MSSFPDDDGDLRLIYFVAFWEYMNYVIFEFWSKKANNANCLWLNYLDYPYMQRKKLSYVPATRLILIYKSGRREHQAQKSTGVKGKEEIILFYTEKFLLSLKFINW